MILAVLLVTAGGTSGGSCNNTIPDPGGGGGNGGGGGTAPTLLASDHVLGDANAPVTVFEYLDFQCPFCGRFARSEFPTVKQNYIDTGKVRWVFRHFPLTSIHDRAMPAAQASECAADQDKFAEYHDLVYNTRDANGDVILTDGQLKAHATTLLLAQATFDACFDGGSKAARVNQDLNSGTALGITGTPTFFVGTEVVSGFQTAAQLGEVIDRQLAGG